MFEALTPTDIVVVGRKPASVRKSGQTLKLVAHADHHRDTVLRVWTESDTIEYYCDQPFEIVGVKRAGWKIFGAPHNPFKQERGATPYKATRQRTSGNPTSVWKWTSGVVPASANNQQYKATFKIRGEKIDPDVVCGSPPPTG